jgi:hypothetical protein
MSEITKTRRYRRTVKATRLSHVAALRFFFRVSLRRSDIIEHTTFVHEPRKLRPGHESNMLSPQLSDLPVGRFVDRGVQPPLQKYFCFHTPQITSRTFRIPPHKRGVS